MLGLPTFETDDKKEENPLETICPVFDANSFTSSSEIPSKAKGDVELVGVSALTMWAATSASFSSASFSSASFLAAAVTRWTSTLDLGVGGEVTREGLVLTTASSPAGDEEGESGSVKAIWSLSSKSDMLKRMRKRRKRKMKRRKLGYVRSVRPSVCPFV